MEGWMRRKGEEGKEKLRKGRELTFVAARGGGLLVTDGEW